MITYYMGYLGLLVLFALFAFREKFPPMIYECFNVVGSGLMIIYSISIEAWPFVVLNVLWTLAAIGHIRDLR